MNGICQAACPIAQLQQRSSEDWLQGLDLHKLLSLTQTRLQQIQPRSNPIVFLTERDPIAFLAGFLAACSHPSTLFLCNPDWGSQEWQQVYQLANPDIVWGDTTAISSIAPEPALTHPLPSTILIPTGGTSGRIRFALHTWDTLSASVVGMQGHFQVDRIQSLCVLPLYHVSGLMQFLRSFITGGKLILWPWKTLESGTLPHITPQETFLSLVPTQLQRLLDARSPATLTFLQSLQAILLGGAPAWAALLETARSHHLPLAPTYGMTETASQVVTMHPQDFLAGRTGVGKALPHATIALLDPTGQPLPAGQLGHLSLTARSLMLGYLDHTGLQRRSTPDFQPDDLGYLDPEGYLHILGRASDKIISGGENIFPAEVEAAIQATGLVQDVCVFGLADRTWGQIVVAAYVPRQPDLEPSVLQQALSPHLSRYKHPKGWISLSHLPRSPQGKLNREQLKQLATPAHPPIS